MEKEVSDWIQSKLDLLGEAANFVTLMTLAIGDNRIDVMDFLVSQRDDLNADINAPGGEDGETILHFVAYTGNVDAMRWLIDQRGAKMDARNAKGQTPMFILAGCGHTEAMRCLKERYADLDLNAKDGVGRTPLFLAVSAGKTESIECLSKLGANMDAQDNQGSTALHNAVLGAVHGDPSVDYVNVVGCLMDNNAKIDDNSPMTPVVYAIAQGQVALLDCMVNKGATVRPIDLFAAAGEGQIGVMEYLKRHFAGRWDDVVNAKLGDMTPRLVAEGQGKTEAAAWLRANGAK